MPGMVYSFPTMQCTLKRCQGKRGCICPKGSVPVGTYAGRQVAADAPQQLSSPEKLPSLSQSPSQLKAQSAPTQKAKPKTTNGQSSLPKLPQSPNVVKTASSEIRQSKEDPKVDDSNSVSKVPAAIEEDDLGGVDGEVTIRFNHYKKKFAIIRGSTTSDVVDAEYYISFAFPKSKIHLTLFGPSDFSFEEQGYTTRPIVKEKPEGTYRGLDPSKEYWVEVEEDAAERKAYEERQDALARENAVKRAEKEARGEEINAIIKTKTESCSCIEGNPCLDRYACKDWEHRYEVAKRNGWKGFQ